MFELCMKNGTSVCGIIFEKPNLRMNRKIRALFKVTGYIVCGPFLEIKMK